MIIDTHAHLSAWPMVGACKKNLLYSMERYGISYSLISQCDCSEFPTLGDRYPIRQISQYQGLKECLEFAREHPRKFGVLVWINPNKQKLNKAFKSLIENNLDIIKGFKFHPYESRLTIEDERLIPYLDYIEKMNMPLLVHTAKDEFSSIFFLDSVAKKYQRINFIAAHLELLEDNKSKIISFMKKHPNIYADTAWVKLSDAKKVLERIGIDRICFGSDNPIDGKETLSNSIYEEYFKNSLKLSKKEINHLMYLNATKIYKIDVNELK